MNEKILVFIGGFIFAVVTASKAYAPNRDEQLGSTPPPPPPPLQPNPQSQSDCPQGTRLVLGEPRNFCSNKFLGITDNNNKFLEITDNKGCPEGMEKKPVFWKMYGVLPPRHILQRDRIDFAAAQRNAPCITNKEAAEIRLKKENEPIPQSVRPRGTMLGFTG